MILEVCAHSLESAIIAQQAGADRIEVCSELAVGGITPSHGMLQQLRDRIQIPAHVLIRPRSGNFSYTESEFEGMLLDIEFCRSLGYEGIVSGCLEPGHLLDLPKLKILRDATRGMHFTFHRAFDWVPDPEAASRQLIDLGIDGLLSSGQKPTAAAGFQLLEKLQKVAATPFIIAGGGINPSNFEKFSGAGFQAIHLSGIPKESVNREKVPLSMNSKVLLREDRPFQSDPTILKTMRSLLNNEEDN